eukprot:snap_masked-scaffold_38-processed-gene-2.62-mRNA-1 protein AED:1.00 eAED:1.00 QI:0/0/0/0/1/1/2/0/77
MITCSAKQSITIVITTRINIRKQKKMDVVAAYIWYITTAHGLFHCLIKLGLSATKQTRSLRAYLITLKLNKGLNILF